MRSRIERGLPNYTSAHIFAAMNAIRSIRKTVFGVTQQEFAEIAGVKQSTVSRWENGVALTLDEMRAIRQTAMDRGIEWKDEWFFGTPVVADAPGVAA
jgi:transcriptional regulator with XRE-family HTH domain